MTANQYARLAKLCRVVSFVAPYWPLIWLALAFLSPVSPHLRLTAAEASTCAYAGGRGIIWESYSGQSCPLIALIDTRGRGQW